MSKQGLSRAWQFWVFFLLGVVSKTIATIATYPLQTAQSVLRARMGSAWRKTAQTQKAASADGPATGTESYVFLVHVFFFFLFRVVMRQIALRWRSEKQCVMFVLFIRHRAYACQENSAESFCVGSDFFVFCLFVMQTTTSRPDGVVCSA